MNEVVLEVNGKSASFRPGTTVADLVASLNLSPSGVAVAVNQVVVPGSERQNTPLNSRDNVEIIHAVGGG
jgi:sulfur carrier protein